MTSPPRRSFHVRRAPLEKIEDRVQVTLILRRSDVEILDRAVSTMMPKTSRAALIEHLMLLGLAQERKVLEAGAE